MTLLSSVYGVLPDSVRPLAERTYRMATRRRRSETYHPEFVGWFFDSPEEYDRYVAEFENGPVADRWHEGLERYRMLTDDDDQSGVDFDTARDYYAVTRKLEPATVIETGVCNGISTLAILLALDETGSGQLHSIDYPLRADESLDEFRRETFDGYGGAAIPSDKDPGWIVPDELRSRWELTVGKSQRELPDLVAETDSLDLFVHDSEHSFPCMMFEYELAYERLREGGVILSDDITWNDAFSTFTDVRDPDARRLSRDVGCIRKNN